MTRFCYQCGERIEGPSVEFYGELFCDSKCFKEFRGSQAKDEGDRQAAAAERIGILCDFKEDE